MAKEQDTILIVDDVPEDISVIHEILKDEYKVKAVTSGEAALAIAQSSTPPDLVLLDIVMPGMNGFEVCRRLKADSAGAIIPVIFLTGKVMLSDEKLGFDLGAVDYIRKPVEPEIIKKRIKSQLEMRDRTVRASEIRFRRLFETSLDGVMIIDNETGIVVDVNPAMAVILGLSQEYFLGKRISDLYFFRGVLPIRFNLSDSLESKYVRYSEQYLETAGGRQLYVELMYNSYKVNQREVTQLNIRDTTEKKKARDRLESLLIEKDELLREIHHRVNNNVQIMISLLNITMGTLTDESLRSKLADITRRMQSMALVNQQFYESDDMSRIDFSAYLQQLIDSFKSDAGKKIKFVLKVSGEPVFLGLDQAIPAGLIVYELFSNAVKFAFPAGGHQSMITITESFNDGFHEVEVRDNGIGLPEHVNPDHDTTLGMTFIRILAEQLGGTVDFARSSGTAAMLKFPLKVFRA